MTRLIRLLPLALLAIAAACAQSKPDTTAADLAAINTLRDSWAKAYNAGDAAAVSALYAADAVMMQENQPAAVGIDAITKANADLMAQFTTAITVTPEETKVSGDWAFDRGQFSLTMTPKMAHDPKSKTPMPGPMSENGKYLVLLQKQTDGSWKVAREMGNSNAPMAMPTADTKRK